MDYRLSIFRRSLSASLKGKNSSKHTFLPISIKGQPLSISQSRSINNLPKETFSMLRIFCRWFCIKSELIFRRNHLAGEFKRMKMAKGATQRQRKRSLLLKSLRRKIEMLKKNVQKLLRPRIFL